MPFFGGVLGISLAPFIRARPSLYRFVKPIADKYQDACGYRKMGLLGDDIIPDENPIVERALARLTDRQRYDRAFRLRTAVQCSVLHHDLPKDQWIKPEEVRSTRPVVLPRS
ncbi:hypothetical protein E5Q_00055 [Mixia osmundae IAM 14324]|uniref:Complex III subunit 7 n=1 Tax=Mixia osmundae (strain CBS 9802 / IAM 14324 / JCM 22182 / KY 12970) TaxID=764103 RepID=G7DS54_MIXOS|nr:hypothetical protein E5Q_00055 [Mixia osmundae IAM 14324]